MNREWKHKSLIGNKLGWKHIGLFVIYKGYILIMYRTLYPNNDAFYIKTILLKRVKEFYKSCRNWGKSMCLEGYVQ